jgi:hypothetical protein
LLDTAASSASQLAQVKLLHTLIWALFAGSILLLPLTAWRGHFRTALVLTVLIVGECAVLALNHGRCPLTDVAARYTNDRAPNFDIYLPAWLARYNKHIFGSLFVAGELVVLWRWTRRNAH